MATDNFECALGSLLKPQEKNRLRKILIEIRKGVEGPNRKDNINLLYENKCLQPLIIKLQDLNLDIINLTLSILGYCFTERRCSRDAVNKYNVLPYLNHILKHHKRDSIQGRIFRIIGNLCQYWAISNNVLEKEPRLQVVTAIVTCLKAFAMPDQEGEERDCLKVTEATVGMGIRAIRELTNCYTVHKLIKDYEVVKAFGMILIKFSTTSQITKQHEHILNVVLKFLYDFTKKYQSFDVIIQLKNTDLGNTLEHLKKLVLLSPQCVVKLALSLKGTIRHKSELPMEEIFQSLMDQLKDPLNFGRGRDDPLHREYLKCVCFLMQHDFVHTYKDEILNSGVVPMLINILRSYTEPTDKAINNCILIIATLRSQYMINLSPSLVVLKHGIVDALSEKLSWMVGTETSVDIIHDEPTRIFSSPQRKRRCDNFEHRFLKNCKGGTCCDYVSQYLRYDICDLYTLSKGSGSPSSDTSYSPPSSPALTLSDVEVNADDYDTDSDDYSPVCSDADDDNIAQSSNTTAEDVAIDDEEDKVEIEEQHEVKEPLESKKHISEEIIKLLKALIIKQPVAKELLSGNLLIKMLKLLYPWNKSVCPSRTLEVIILFIQTPKYLIGIMQSDFVNAAHKFMTLPHGIICRTCATLSEIGRTILTKLTKIVDDKCGEGDIAHQLYRASLPIKQNLVLSVPFITCNKQTLTNLMITCGGLNIMMQLFQENPAVLEKCINGLFVMSIKLGIKNPTFYSHEYLEKLCKIPTDIGNYCLDKDCMTIVRFKLDDDTCVEADRNLLSQKSDYFNRLLFGEFKESWEEEVQLCNVSNSCLKFLLTLLNVEVNTTKIYKFDVDLEVLLDAISLTDRYLMEDLCVCLTTSVQYLKISPKTVSAIYQWSLESGTNILRVESVAYVLVACVQEKERFDIFSNLTQLGYTQHLSDDIQKLLARFLC